mmetsp:Transcript_87722/g.256406  ORF Transcript_87722/g.256406 Transcript_87722/m.256406 type:complete len:705 (-) Transcript_87722:95-2209(-)
MTLGFDFDQLEEEDGASEGEQRSASEAEWPSELAAELERSERTQLPDEVRVDSSGRARGFCLQCHCCRGWAPSSSSTAVPRGPELAEGRCEAGEQAGSHNSPPPMEARGACLPPLSGAMPSFDGRRFVWPWRGGYGGRRDSSRCCARCGCREMDHEDVEAKFGRFLGERGPVPLAALQWSRTEVALWADTEGLFQPGGRRSYCADEQKPGVLVSVICPTMSSRICFHPFLWHCFSKQDHAPRELVVVDTSEEEPSAFLEEKARTDKRLLYKHFRVPERKWCIGLKRNLACYYAAGEVIAHFDDDDMYAPCYLSVMLKCLRDPREAFVLRGMNHSNNQHEVGEMLYALNFEETPNGAQMVQLSEKAQFWNKVVCQGWGSACAKLSAWFNFSIRDRSWCFSDATDSETGFTKDSRQEIYGWGFSLVYLRVAWEAIPFLHIDLGEDLDFVQSFRELQLPLVLVPDRKGICAHTQHLENISGTCVKGGARGSTPPALLYSPLASVLSWYELTAQGFCQYQESLKEGTAGKAAAPPILLPDESKPVAAVKEVLEPKVPQEWRPGMKWTKEAVVMMQEDLLEAFLEESFQKRLHGTWRKLDGQPRKQEVQRRDACMEIQAPVLERYGFEGSMRGLFQCAIDCRFEDEQVGLLDRVLHWLTHPGDKAWHFFGPQLDAFRTDRSIGTLRACVCGVHEGVAALEQQEEAAASG